MTSSLRILHLWGILLDVDVSFARIYFQNTENMLTVLFDGPRTMKNKHKLNLKTFVTNIHALCLILGIEGLLKC